MTPSIGETRILKQILFDILQRKVGLILKLGHLIEY